MNTMQRRVCKRNVTRMRMVSNYRISSRLQCTSINSESDRHQLTSELHYSIQKNLILVQ